MAADEYHVENACHGNRYTDPGIFKETELKIPHARRFQGYVGDDVRRGTDEGAGTAETRCKGKRHHFTGNGNVRFFTDTDNHRNKTRRGACIGQEGRHDSSNNHNADHQFNFPCTKKLDDLPADILGKTGVKHGGAYDKHTAEEDDRRIGKSQKYLFNRHKAQKPAKNGREN